MPAAQRASDLDSPGQRPGDWSTFKIPQGQRPDRLCLVIVILITAGPLALKRHLAISYPARWAGLCKVLARWAVERRCTLVMVMECKGACLFAGACC